MDVIDRIVNGEKYSVSNNKIEELGKLILDESPCHWDYQYKDGDCYYDSCKFNEVCKLRNEILKGGKL